MFANQFRLMPVPARKAPAPPPWAVLSVKCCVVGILALPLVVPLLLAGRAAFGPIDDDSFRRAAFFGSVGLWVAMFVLAQYLITVYPPVPRR
jgi:hypothetical protein